MYGDWSGEFVCRSWGLKGLILAPSLLFPLSGEGAATCRLEASELKNSVVSRIKRKVPALKTKTMAAESRFAS